MICAMLPIDDEVQKLIAVLEAADPRHMPLAEMLQAVVRFFEKLFAYSLQASAEERRHWAAKIVEVSEKVQPALKKFIDAVGLSEDALSHHADQAERSHPELWKQYEEARRQVADLARKISSSLAAAATPAEAVDRESTENPEGKKPTQPKRSTWMKS